MTSAFLLRNVAAVNFYLYAQDFPIQGNAVFLGGNGSGKSMLLDAIQIVMTGMNKRYLNLNSRVAEGGRSTRTVREACLGLLDDGKGFERNSCLTYIALGFETADRSRRCTAGVCLEARQSLSEETVLGLFIVEDVLLQFADFVDTDGQGFKEKAWQSFGDEQRRRGRIWHSFPSQNNRGFLRHLYSIINANARGTQLDPDRARNAMRQTLSFDIGQITSVTEFVKKFLLDVAPIEIDTFQQRYATWRELQREIARIEREIQAVESIRSLCSRVLNDQFLARYWQYGSQRAEYDRHKAILDRRQQELEKAKLERASQEAYRDRLDRTIEEIQQQHHELQQQIAATNVGDQIKNAELALVNQQATRRAAIATAHPVRAAIMDLATAVQAESFPADAFVDLAAFCRSLPARAPGFGDAAWADDAQQVSRLVASVPPLSAAIADLTRQHGEIAAERARLSTELKELDEQLAALQSGRALMSAETSKFLAELTERGVPAHTLSELTDIAPPLAEWRGIVEAVLGDWCDALIVAPDHMDVAYGHFDRHYKGTRAKLVQSENASRDPAQSLAGTLAEAVVTKDPYAQAFIRARLGRIVRARSPTDIRRGDLAASADGKYAHGRGIEYRRLRALPRLGLSVRAEQTSFLSRDRERIARALRDANLREERTRSVLEGLRRAHEPLEAQRDASLHQLAAVDRANDDIARQQTLIAQLKANLPRALIEASEALEADLGSHKKEKIDVVADLSAIDERIGEVGGQIRTSQEARSRAAAEARRAIPSRDLRRCAHQPVLGFEGFVRRARAAYRRDLATAGHPGELRNRLEGNSRNEIKAQRAALGQLSTAVQNYVQDNPDHHPGFEYSKAIFDERTTPVYDWISLRHRHLTESVLKRFKTQVDNALVALVESMVNDFLSRLHANIESVDRIKDDLNHSLRRSVFMNEIYQIRQERDQDKETVRYLTDRLDIVGPKATALMQQGLDPSDPDQKRIKELIDMLTVEGGDEAAHRKRLQELSDYRNYFRFAIDICEPDNGNRRVSDFEQRRGKASGGQKFLPFYICLGVAAAAAYRNHLGDSQTAPPQSALLLMDEAFEKLDPENIYKIIGFYKDLGLQLIMAAPKTHQALYQETFDTLVSIIRIDRAIQATVQHFHPAAHHLLHEANPQHKPRSYFVEQLQRERDDAAE